MGDERENHYLVCCSHGKDGSLPLPQPVGVALAHTIEINLDLKVEVADISGVWLHAEHPGHLVPLLAGQVLVKVEHCLLPVGMDYEMQIYVFIVFEITVFVYIE